jgi:hypothetical protein
MITAKNTDTSRVDYVNTTLASFMYTAAKVRTKTAETLKEYQIPVHTVFDIHLQLIKDRCTLFKLAEVSKNEVKRKLLYLSLDNEARAWMHSVNEETILDWEDMKKAFYLKYYPPIEDYRDRGLIYNF